MKIATKNSIIRYAISSTIVIVFILAAFLINMGFEWIANKTGWPIYQTICIVGFIYFVWRFGREISLSKRKEE